MLQVSAERIWRSLAVREPRRASITMWVSRLSIPPQARSQQVSMHPDLARETPNEGGRLGLDRHQPRYRLPVLCDHDALRSQPVEDRETLLLELRGADGGHDDDSSSGRK